MIPTAGRTAHDHRPARTGVRGSPLAAIGALAAVCALLLGLTACGGSAQAEGAVRAAGVTSWTDAGSGAQAVDRQADAQLAAVTASALTAAADAAERAAADQARQVHQAEQQAAQSQECTTRPEDRAACTMPEGAQITPGGGDVDGDGVFEPHEPVGPGYKDPRAYDGGPTSGEVQCEWARQQGYGC